MRAFLNLSAWRLSPSTGPALDPLDGLRGIAILMVTTFHTFYFNPGSAWPFLAARDFLSAGWMGVPLFFVLSGFLISHGFWEKRKKGGNTMPNQYFRRRFFKIAPPFYLSLVVFTCIYFALTQNTGYWGVAALYATGLNNFIPERLVLNPAYWSLAVEVQFYVVLPLLFLATRQLRNYAASSVIIGSLLLVPFLTRWLILDHVVVADDFNFRIGMFPNQLDYFAWGVTFAWMYSRRSLNENVFKSLSKLSYVGVVLFFGAMIFWAAINENGKQFQRPTLLIHSIIHIWLGVAGFFLLFSVFLPLKSFLRRTLGNPALMLMGIVSYEWFLFHQPIIIWMRDLIGHTGGNIGLYFCRTVFPLFATFVLAAVIYRFFSLPILRLGRKSKTLEVSPIKSQAEATM